MQPNRFQTFFQLIIDSLQKHTISYVLFGGMVMPFYGNVRSTQYIDLMLLLDEIEKERISNWLTDLENLGLVMSNSEIITALNEKIHSNIFDPQTFVFRVDLKAIHSTLDRLTYKFKQKVEIYERNVWINCPESQIAVKTSEEYRSDTDLEDALVIVQKIDLDIEVLLRFLALKDGLHYFCNWLGSLDTHRSNVLHDKLSCGN